MNRRRLLVSAAGVSTAALGVPWLASASAATDDELAFANFGVSVELLLEDFYALSLDAKVFSGAQNAVLRSGRSAAAQHAKTLGGLLVGAGQTAPARDDFDFAWPDDTFSGASAITTTGAVVLRALLGSYQTASATVADPDYRILYASLVASVAQQTAALSTLSGRAGAEPFPVAIDLEAASASLEAYLG